MTYIGAFLITILLGTLLIWVSMKAFDKFHFIQNLKDRKKNKVTPNPTILPKKLTKHQYNRLRQFTMSMQKAGVSVEQLSVAFEEMRMIAKRNNTK